MFLGTTIKNWWKALSIVAFIGIIFAYVDVYALSDTHRDHLWKEQLILPFYFTLISNMFALGSGIIKGFTKYGSHKFAKRIEVFAFVNLLITFLVYWTLLFPFGIPKHTISWFTNMLVHLITPAFMISMFLIQNIKHSERHKFQIFKNTSYHMLFVLGYLVFALIIYYSLGAHKEDAIYSFLAFEQNSWYMSVAISLGIGIAYYWLTFLGYLIINKYSKIK